jgi:hypothetical protein
MSADHLLKHVKLEEMITRTSVRAFRLATCCDDNTIKAHIKKKNTTMKKKKQHTAVCYLEGHIIGTRKSGPK